MFSEICIKMLLNLLEYVLSPHGAKKLSNKSTHMGVAKHILLVFYAP